VDDRIVMEGTHKAIVGRKTWQRAKEKLAAEQEHTSYAPRNPRYYLKNVLVCGHCGKGMVGRLEGGTVVYVCRSYAEGRSNGHDVACGFHRIRHDDAERMLLDKIKEQNLEFEQMVSTAARENLEERLAQLGHDNEAFAAQWRAYLDEGIDALADYVIKEYGVNYPELPRIRRLALDHFCGDELADSNFNRLPLELAAFHKALRVVEAEAVAAAHRKIAELTKDVERFTLGYMETTGIMQQDVLKRKADEAEAGVAKWRPCTVPLSERIDRLFAAEKEQTAEREALLEEMPTLEYRERGEAFRRLFTRVELYWDQEWRPRAERPTRERKTDRPGRYKYTLRNDLTVWALAATDLGCSW
jgi:hypothetical protein